VRHSQRRKAWSLYFNPARSQQNTASHIFTTSLDQLIAQLGNKRRKHEHGHEHHGNGIFNFNGHERRVSHSIRFFRDVRHVGYVGNVWHDGHVADDDDLLHIDRDPTLLEGLDTE
jgi:hypothetical protein